MYNIGIIGNGFVGSAITSGFGLYAKIKIYTHKIKGLVESDFILAAKIDKIKF